ncbi:MAG TPA: GNAT family N-acetyltransferase [Micromonosporaceae bacterium]|nr:GNAT family N-acetyltransferase [Micromonosporaceae bacterium]
MSNGESDGVSDGELDLGATLRALRRRGDLSQRELAARAGVAQSTVARIESGRESNPPFRTAERLIRAAGEALSVAVGPAVEPVPQEELRDAANRHYPAHLDIDEVTRPERWWGAWWTLTVAQAHWPLDEVPPYTYDRARHRRDRRRERAARGRTVVIRRALVPGLDDRHLLWVAEASESDATRVGELRAHRTSLGQVKLDGVVVAPRWRGCGIGRRLIEAVRAEAAGASVVALSVGLDQDGFLRACGFDSRGCGATRWLG